MTRFFRLLPLARILVTLAACLLFFSAPALAGNVFPHQTRMGTTPWVPELSEEGKRRVAEFLPKNINIIAHHFDGGLPWQQALDNTEYPKNLRDDWAWRKKITPPGVPVYLALTPLDINRTGLAPYWNEKADNQPLPKAWKNLRLNDPKVKAAYLNHARRAIDFFRPAYVAIGIESNILVSKKPKLLDDYIDLQATTYMALKKEYPQLPVFVTVQYEYLRGINSDAKKTLHLQEPAIRKMMAFSDLMGLSTYQHGRNHGNPITPDYFAAAEKFAKPIVIAETGALSKSVRIYMVMNMEATDEDQRIFLDGLLEQAARKRFPFVINWVPIDYDPLIPELPWYVRELAKAWLHTGLQYFDGRNKPAHETWQRWLKAYRGAGHPQGG